ncbi:hypothetical protein KR044_001415, partial [Drosophila immigrans]
ALFVALALIGSEARPSHHFDQHFDHHFNHFEPLHGHVDHVDYSAPLLESFAPVPAPAPAPLWPAPAPLAPAPAPLWPAPAPAPLWAPAPAPVLPAPAPLLPAPAPLWTPAPAPLLPAALPAPLWPAPAQLAPAPLLPAAIPCPPAAHTHVLPTTEVHLPTVTQLLPPVLESVPFASSYRAIPGPKTTSHRVSLGYAFPKLLAAPHAHLRALPLKLAHHHHHHSLF